MFYGWRVVALTMLTQAFQAGFLIYSFGVIIAPYGEAFGVSRQTLMLGSTLLSLSTNLISPLAGDRVDRWSIRSLMMLGVVMLGTGFIALSQARAIWQVLATFALILPAGNLLLGQMTSSALMTRWFTKLRGRALGISAIGTSLGGFFIPPLVATLSTQLGWRSAYAALGIAIMLVGIPLVRAVVVDRPEDRNLLPDGELSSDLIQPDERPDTDPEYSFREIATTLRFWCITVAIGLVLAVFIGLLGNLVLHATDQGASTTQAAALMSVVAVFGIGGKLLFGTLADKIALRTALWLAMALMAGALCTMLLVPGYSGLALGCVMLGLAAGGQLPVWGAMVAQAFGRRSFGRALGIMNPAMMPITLAGPPLAGRVFDMTGGYDLAFQIYLGALVVGALVLVPLQLDPRSEEAV